ncbi:MAG: hypothetical protein ACI8TQ_000872 [Planctomycetota bacterium]
MSKNEVAGSAGNEKTGCVVGISFGLLLILGLVSSMFESRGVELQPDVVLSEQFEYGPIPFELELVSAAMLPGGDRLVRLSHPDFRIPEPKPEELDEGAGNSEGEKGMQAGSSDGGKGGGWGMGDGAPWTPPEIEWKEDSAPTEVFFVFNTSPAGALKVFRGSQESPSVGSSGGGGGRSGGRRRGGRSGFSGMSMGAPGEPIAMGGGDLNWGRSRVGYRHERRFEEESGSDEIRVNLSEAGRFCVLVVRWQENHAGSDQRVEELLEAFTRLESALPAEQAAL